MMTCEQLIGFLDAYIEGTMSRPQRKSFEAHLAVCADCVDYLASYRTTIDISRRALRAVNDVQRAPGLPDELVHAVLSVAKR
jgi:anti-sigma factor RsiW